MSDTPAEPETAAEPPDPLGLLQLVGEATDPDDPRALCAVIADAYDLWADRLLAVVLPAAADAYNAALKARGDVEREVRRCRDASERFRAAAEALTPEPAA